MSTCFFPWKPNAGTHLLPEAAAKRRLEAVRCSALILIEAPSSAYPCGMLRLGNITLSRGGDLRRFSTTQHPWYCGIDRHAHTMDVCILSQDGEGVLHRHMQAAPASFLTALAPDRDGRAVAV